MASEENRDGSRAVNGGVFKMSKRTSLGDRLVVEGTIEKQADDNEECERLVEEAEEEI
ncbi:hypothetical protein M9H77_35086 [Catharanthus roseus]|uniref:Uncharacterized protein n=1 Tax=Catharanthus roseus TaxID=4058 RepID=A0ACB9ZP94_CATRO|nr:hypothetical protein M9H77_35086 [Catharanthus roseus]